jgi:oligopeptide/dipeptide ABC transporter ATP-binding protein
MEGEVPTPIDLPPGCPFHPRCSHCMDRCKTERPHSRQIDRGWQSACHLNDTA